MRNKLGFLILLTCLSMNNGTAAETAEVKVVSGHPRIMMLAGEEKSIRDKVASDSFLAQAHESILMTSEKMLSYPQLERVKTGKRLLEVSRKALKQIYYLSYSYRMTGDVRFADQAEKVMLQVCSFSDWNPSHFLDVAEMTAAVSIGYDWLYDRLNETSRSIIRKAILEKGLYESLPEKTDSPANLHWLDKKNNWNAVCNMGMACGAVAIYEDCPELASEIILRSVKSAKENTLREYWPDGNYPEGYMYWNYGTNFLVMLADIVEKATDLDFGLEDDPAFMRSGDYMVHMTTQGFGCFDYSDCNVKENKLCLPLFWMASVRNDRSLLYGEAGRIEYLQNIGKGESLFTFRLLPSLLIWAPENCIGSNTAPAERLFVGQGETPVALLRNHFGGEDEIFVGLKGGACENGHSHMDIGSFVMYRGRHQWFKDLGYQDYNSLEKEGLDLFRKAQDSPRWQPFRIGMYSHNLIVFDDSLQRIKPRAEITSFGDRDGFVYAATDLTEVQGGLVESYRRGVAIVDDCYATVRDEIRTQDKDVRIRWAALTPASVEILDDMTALLTIRGDSLYVKVEGKGVKLETYSTDPPHYYDMPNPGTVMLGFSMTLERNTSHDFNVYMIPAEYRELKTAQMKDIDTW